MTTKERKRPDKIQRRTRIADLADALGISQSTVSRALSGEKGVSPGLRDQIVSMAKDAGYPIASNLRGTKVVLIASADALLDYGRNQFTWNVLEGLKNKARITGIELVTRDVSRAESASSLFERIEHDGNTSGVLLLTVDDRPLLERAVLCPKPVVLINCEHPLMHLTSVAPCNRTAARMASEYLVEHGHREQIFLMRKGRPTIHSRLEGWRDVMQLYAMRCDQSRIVEVEDWTAEHARQTMLECWHTFKGEVTAILAAGDPLAAGAIQALRQLGVNVPTEVSVMGIDDLPQSAYLDPPLTTMHIPMHEIGMTALGLLHDLPHTPRRIELAATMAIRESVSPANIPKYENQP